MGPRVVVSGGRYVGGAVEGGFGQLGSREPGMYSCRSNKKNLLKFLHVILYEDNILS